MPKQSVHITQISSKRYASRSMRALPLIILVWLAIGMLASCDDEKKEVISGKTDPETTPTMTTRDVSTLISDSGITRYKITSPLWLMYEEAKEPKWRFPNGLHLEKFDLRFKPEASIDCDSATYHKDRQIWQLDGYVNVRNTQGEKFLTNQLFWNQRQQKIYSDSFIHIERDGKVIEGYGFESNEQMTRYHVLRVAGIFPAEQFKQPANTPQRSDSINKLPTATPAPGITPFNPNNPHIIISGQDDDSRFKKRNVRSIRSASAIKPIKVEEPVKPRKKNPLSR